MKRSKAIMMAVSTGVIVCLVTCLLTIAIYQKKLAGDENSLNLNEFGSVGDMIDEYYLYDYDIKDVQDAGLKAMVESLDDPYSVYFTQEEFDAFNQNSAGEYVGIGILISENKDTGYTEILKFFPGSSAEEQGIQVGDLIVEIDGEDVTGLTTNEIGVMCTGEEGTFITLGVLRDGEEHSYELERRVITIDMAEYEMLEDNIGYLNIMQFSGNAYDKFKEAMDFFKEQGAKGVVVDLRDNPGGYLNVVVDMLDDILPEGTLVYTEDKYGNRETEYSGPDSIDMQFMVLVNGNTASASEIFAGAMQDYEYGAVVGTTTYGKGVVQAVLPMDDTGAGLKLTISEYFTPNGRNINGKGIEPDIYIEDDGSGEDVQMDKAVSVLKDRIG